MARYVISTSDSGVTLTTKRANGCGIFGPANGPYYDVPVATRDEFARFVADMRAVDPNGVWSHDPVERFGPFGTDMALAADDPEDYPDVWVAWEDDEDGERYYALEGWQFVEVADDWQPDL